MQSPSTDNFSKNRSISSPPCPPDVAGASCDDGRHMTESHDDQVVLARIDRYAPVLGTLPPGFPACRLGEAGAPAHSHHSSGKATCYFRPVALGPSPMAGWWGGRCQCCPKDRCTQYGVLRPPDFSLQAQSPREGNKTPSSSLRAADRRGRPRNEAAAPGHPSLDNRQVRLGCTVLTLPAV